jgi:CHAD domain-containing protein
MNATSASAVMNRPEYISQAALELFDCTQPLHELDEMYRQITSLAGLMYDHVLHLSKKKPIKGVETVVKDQLGVEITAEVKMLLILVLALYTGRIKRKDILHMDLPTLQQRAILTMAALLMIAAGLDNSESQSTIIKEIGPAQDDIWVVVDGPQAAQDAAAATHAARLWTKIGYSPINVLEEAEAQRIKATFAVFEQIPPVMPDDILSEAGRKVMHQHFQAMLANEEGTRLGEDIEALHDMRVATRRLRAAFEVFDIAFDAQALKKHLRGLRATGRALGMVRDQDVFMEKLELYQQAQDQKTRDGLHPLLESWQGQRAEARAQMLVYLDSKDYANFKQDFNEFVHTAGAGALPLPKGIPTPHRVRELAPALIYERLAAVRAFDSSIDNASIETLHALRIEFKKLRYTVEYFRDVLGPKAKDIIEELKSLQDHLGDLNDAQVATQILKDFLKEEKKKNFSPEQSLETEIQAIEAYLEYQRQERQRLRDGFPAAWAHFNRQEFMQNVAMAVSVL